MKRKLIYAVLCACLFGMLAAVASAQHFAFRTYGLSEGLKSLSVRYIVQDAQGTLIICTEGGVYRYDGADFKRIAFNASDEQYVTGAARDNEGRVWFSTLRALYLMDHTGVHSIPEPPGGFDFDLHATMATLQGEHGRLYFVSRRMLYVAEQSASMWTVAPVFSPELVREHPQLKDVTFVAGQDDRLWVGCGFEICSFSAAAGLHVYGAAENLPQQRWRLAFADSKHRLWARSEGSLYRLDRDAKAFVPAGLSLPSGALAARGTAIVEDKQGRILINLGEGLARLEGGNWNVLQGGADLPVRMIDTLFVDRQGSVWVGWNGKGLGRWLGYDNTVNWTTMNGLRSDIVWNFARDRSDRMWIATESGLEMMEAGSRSIRQQAASSRIPLHRVQSIAMASDGHFWTGSDDGSVFDYDPATGEGHKVAQLTGVFQIRSDSAGRMWICTLNGLYVVSPDDPSRSVQMITGRDAPSGQVYVGVQDKGNALWFIAGSGLFRLIGGTWTKIELPATYHPTLSAQLSIGHDGTFWISGNQPNLVHLRVRGNKAELLEQIPWASGDVNVFLVKTDSRGWVWAGTGEGLYLFNGSRWSHCGVEDGLVWNDINSNSFYEDKDGTVWIGTSGGMTHFVHPERLFTQEQLTAQITEVKIGEKLLALFHEGEVPWGRDPLTAHLVSTDFQRESSITFRYRMVGLEEDWQDTPQHDLRYPALPAGEYRLEVIALDEGTGRKSDTASAAFRILPPWWKTRTMWAVYIVSPLLLCLLVWRWSVRFFVRRQRHLEAVVQERTRELLQEKRELLKARQELQIQATHDSLTGLLNRGAIMEHLEQEVERARREGTTFALLLLDIDHFKRVNDTWGHSAGDCVLREYARRLGALARPYDVVGRYGGEEMMMLLPGLTRSIASTRLPELHAALCAEPIGCNGHYLNITCSIGVSWYELGRSTAQRLIDLADDALYRAKDEGRNRIVFADEDVLDMAAVRE